MNPIETSVKLKLIKHRKVKLFLFLDYCPRLSMKEDISLKVPKKWQ